MVVPLSGTAASPGRRHGPRSASRCCPGEHRKPRRRCSSARMAGSTWPRWTGPSRPSPSSAPSNQYRVTATERSPWCGPYPTATTTALNPSVTTRLVTGIAVTGTAQSPEIYVVSSDPRIGAGTQGTDLNLDTNSGILSRLRKVPTGWQKLDLVRGLPLGGEPHRQRHRRRPGDRHAAHRPRGEHQQGGDLAQPRSSRSSPCRPPSSPSISAIGGSTYDLPTLDDEEQAGFSRCQRPLRRQRREEPGPARVGRAVRSTHRASATPTTWW